MFSLTAQFIRALFLSLLLIVTCFGAAHAQWVGHSDITRFSEGDEAYWQKGQWKKALHDGRDGWWWVVTGGGWYPYPAVVKPYPDPYTPGFDPPLPPSKGRVYYYCASPQGYYPYVAICPSAWQAAVPQDSPTSATSRAATAASGSATVDLADLLVMKRALEKAFHGQLGREVAWNNPDTGNSGVIVPTADSHDTLAHPCRTFRVTTVTGGRYQDANEKYCRSEVGGLVLTK